MTKEQREFIKNNPLRGPCNCCNDQALRHCNFEILSRLIYELDKRKFNPLGWDKEPQEYKWEYRNKARSILDLLNIETDKIPSCKNGRLARKNKELRSLT